MIYNHEERLSAARAAGIAAVEKAGYKVDCAKPTGSAYYGAKNPKDYDCLMLVTDTARGVFSFDTGVSRLVEELKEAGWSNCAEDAGYPEADNEDWAAMRKGEYNIILCAHDQLFYRMYAATELVKSLSIEHNTAPAKDAVVELFKKIRGD